MGERSKSPLENFCIKLKELKKELKAWKKKIFENVNRRMESLIKLVFTRKMGGEYLGGVINEKNRVR